MSMKIDGEKGQAGYLLGLVFCVRGMAGKLGPVHGQADGEKAREIQTGLVLMGLRARPGSWALCSLGPPACCPQAAGKQPLNG